MMYDHEVWSSLPVDDLWIYDKLILSKKLGHVCGPASISVPVPGLYVIRPITNLMGMGRGASLEYIECTTDHISPGYFWQQHFVGRHLSIDYHNGIQVRCTEGFRQPGELIQFERWTIVDDIPTIPICVNEIISRYEYVNVEMVDGCIIEVHLRGNPDFFDNPYELIPVWKGQEADQKDGLIYTEEKDSDRIGYYKRFISV